MGEAIAWGCVAASSLVLGALIAFARQWSNLQVGLVLAFGAGALISAASFELAEEGAAIGGTGTVALGLVLGALTYFALDGLVAHRFSGGRGRSGRAESSDPGPALALGAFLDGVPEQLVLGIGIALGEGVGVALLVAIFVSNLPEAIGSATVMRRAGSSRRSILLLWTGVAALCVVASAVGYGVADAASNDVKAVINGFGAGALLVMLVDSMIPEATRDAGRTAGLATALGFALAAGLSGIV